MNRVIVAFCFICMSFYLYSCTTGRESAEQGRYEYDRILIERLNHHNGRIHTVDARALVVFREADRNFSFRATLSVENHGENLRLDLSDFVFKKPLLSIVKNGEQVTTILYTKRSYFEMPYEQLDMKKISGLNIRKEILLSALMGKVYIEEQNSVTSSPEPHLLIIENSYMKETISFNDQLLPVSVFYDFQNDVYTMTFREYIRIGDLVFPKKVTVRNQDRVLEANYSDVSVNQPLDPEIFHVSEEDIGGFERKNL